MDALLHEKFIETENRFFFVLILQFRNFVHSTSVQFLKHPKDPKVTPQICIHIINCQLDIYDLNHIR